VREPRNGLAVAKDIGGLGSGDRIDDLIDQIVIRVTAQPLAIGDQRGCAIAWHAHGQ
jgi:hypothetical protein